jgi:xanthine dehydrogenase/oxidase
VLYYGQLLQNCTLHSVWDELKASCNFVEARKSVEVFNSNNRWRKRGIVMVPTKFGISFTTKFMNQVNSFPSLTLYAKFC